MTDNEQFRRPGFLDFSGLRGGDWMLMGLGIGLAFALVLPSILFVQITIGGGAGPDPQSDNVRIIFAVVFVVGLFVSYRLLNVRAVVSDDGLLVVNPSSTHLVTWAEIDAVEFHRRRVRGGYSSRVTVAAGRRFNIAAAMSSWDKRRTVLAPLIDGCDAHGVRIVGLGT